eukprot:73751_1
MLLFIKQHTEEFISGITMSLFVLYMILLAYYGYKYKTIQDSIVFKKRFGHITLYEVYCMVLNLFFACVWVITNYLVKSLIATQILYLIASTFASLLFWTWVWRFWMIHYNIQWTNAYLENKWKQVIDPSYHNEHNNWYIDNKKKYGNKSWILHHIIIPIIIFCFFFCYIPDTIAPFFGIAIWVAVADMIQSIVPFISFAILFIIYCKTPSVRDNFFILYEMKYMMFALLCSCIFDVVDSFVPDLWRYTSDDKVELILMNVAMNFGFFFQFIAMMVGTFWVSKKARKIINSSVYDLAINSNTEHNNSLNVPFMVSKSINNADKLANNIKLTLLKILSNRQALEIFFNYLLMDLSLEIIVSFIELIQFQQFIHDKLTQSDYDIEEKKDDEELLYLQVKFHSSIPQSQIVYGDQKSWDKNNRKYRDVFLSNCRVKTHRLFVKYVEYGISEFELTFENDDRNHVNDLLQDEYDWIHNDEVDLKQLLDLFQGCCNELFSLMLQSLSRFQQTEQYKELKDSKAL